MTAVIGVLASCVGPPSSDAAGTWSPRASIVGGGRLEAAVVAWEGRLVVVGGFDRNLDIVARVDAYDVETDAWTALEDMPVALTHANAAVVGAKLYVLGGLAGVDFAGSGAAFVYENDAWSELAPLPVGAERGASGVAVDGTRIVLAGGSAGSVTLSSVLSFETTTGEWSALPDLPSPRSHPVAASVGGTIVVIGGLSQVDGTGPLAETLVLEGDTWTPRAPMPTARGGCASGILAGRFICAGGETATSVVAATEAYDPAADVWTTLAPMLTPRAGTYGASLADGLHVPGGARVLMYIPSALHEVLTWP